MGFGLQVGSGASTWFGDGQQQSRTAHESHILLRLEIKTNGASHSHQNQMTGPEQRKTETHVVTRAEQEKDPLEERTSVKKEKALRVASAKYSSNPQEASR
jgi:hypothetical protein